MNTNKINFQNIPVQAGIISNIINVDILSHNCFQKLDDLISSDQGVASLVLRVVNSALYSRGNKVATIPLAISLLGYSVLRSLALLAFSRSFFFPHQERAVSSAYLATLLVDRNRQPKHLSAAGK